jgi:hypothetical protein
MIPALNQSGVLPPFIPELGPTDPAGMAPYRASITEFVQRYAYSEQRKAILKGLLTYRARLRAVGITDGFQWLDGSFVENVESNQGRPPNDIDLVTFADRPQNTRDEDKWRSLVYENKDLFLPDQSKGAYLCDAYFVDLNTSPLHIVNSTKYWFGLFSHQRESYLWKGMIEIPLICSDDEAQLLLELEEENA